MKNTHLIIRAIFYLTFVGIILYGLAFVALLMYPESIGAWMGKIVKAFNQNK